LDADPLSISDIFNLFFNFKTNKTMNSYLEYIKIGLQIFGFLVTIAAVVIAYNALKTSLKVLNTNQEVLKANHDWNRRHFAVQLLEKWNHHTRQHRELIETKFPQIYDCNILMEDPPCIDISVARKIYACTPLDDDWKLRFSLHELLNHFEYISVSYMRSVADKEIVEDSFKNILIKWHHILNPFIQVVEKNWGFNPWQPYSDFIKMWDEKPKSLCKPTG
jgi:hypothetical protein